MDTLTSLVQGMPRAKIVERTGDDYLYAVFTTPLFGFCDDVEFFVAADDGVVHVRSQSRLGYGDGGVNRKRVEAIRRKWLAATTNP